MKNEYANKNALVFRYASKWSVIAPQWVSLQWWELTMSPLKELEAATFVEASDIKASQEKKFNYLH